MVFFRKIGVSTVLVGFAATALLVSLIALGINDADHLFGYLIAFLGFPFVLNIQHKATWRAKYGIISLVFLVAYLSLGIETLSFLTVCFAALYLIENTFGQVSFKALMYLFISTPFFDFIARLLSFPIRLKLTNWAVSTLQYAYPGIYAEGNVIYKSSTLHFSVDPECMGLNMVSLSLAVALIVTAVLEKERRIVLNKLENIIAVLIMLFLAIFANFMRIITLVVMESFPDTVGHEIIGLACLALYAFVPYYLLSKLYFFKRKRSNWKIARADFSSNKKLAFLSCIQWTIALCLLFAPVHSHVEKDPSFDFIQIEGFQKSLLKHDILQLKKEGTLIYIKPPVDFYGAHHSPLICWTGSGYVVQNRTTKQVSGKNVSFGILKHQNDTLHTAWWFDNGINKDNGNWDWRLDRLKGAPAYRLINVTCNDPQTLQVEVEKLLPMNLFEADKKEQR